MPRLQFGVNHRRWFHCQHCGRDFREPRNHRQRACCQRSLRENDELRQQRPRSSGDIDDSHAALSFGMDSSVRIEAIDYQVEPIQVERPSQHFLEFTDWLVRDMTFRLRLDTTAFSEGLRGLALAMQLRPTRLLLDAAHDIVCGRLRPTALWAEEMMRMPLHDVTAGIRLTRAERNDIMRRARRLQNLDFRNHHLGAPFEPARGRQTECAIYNDADRIESPPPRRKPMCTFPDTGGQFEADLREIEHPRGLFVRPDGSRFDIICMDLKHAPGIKPPTLGVLATAKGCGFMGDRLDTWDQQLRVGYCRLRHEPLDQDGFITQQRQAARATPPAVNPAAHAFR